MPYSAIENAYLEYLSSRGEVEPYSLEDIYREEQAAMQSTRTWQTADGKVIRVSNLTSSHLVNIYNHIRRHGYPDVTKNMIFSEIFRRGLSIEFIEAEHPNVSDYVFIDGDWKESLISILLAKV